MRLLENTALQYHTAKQCRLPMYITDHKLNVRRIRNHVFFLSGVFNCIVNLR